MSNENSRNVFPSEYCCHLIDFAKLAKIHKFRFANSWFDLPMATWRTLTGTLGVSLLEHWRNKRDECGAMGDGCEPTGTLEKGEWWKQRGNCYCNSYEKDGMIQAHQKKRWNRKHPSRRWRGSALEEDGGEGPYRKMEGKCPRGRWRGRAL